jgi:hypothetical protein
MVKRLQNFNPHYAAAARRRRSHGPNSTLFVMIRTDPMIHAEICRCRLCSLLIKYYFYK